jgi:predicted O-methyltransferase YrrM
VFTLVALLALAWLDVPTAIAAALLLGWMMLSQRRVLGRNRKLARRAKEERSRIEGQIEELRSLVVSLDQRFEGPRQALNGLSVRLEGLQSSVGEGFGRLEGLQSSVDAAFERMDGFAASSEETAGLLEGLGSRVDEVFHQTENLIAIYRLLEPPAPLPPTRIWAMSPDVLRHLAEIVLAQRPAVVVECGSGVSTAVVALALKSIGAGKIIALEHLDWARRDTERLLAAWDVLDYAEVRCAPMETHTLAGDSYDWYASSTLPEGPIDLLVIDGPPSGTGPQARYPAGVLLLPRMSPQGRAILDDTSRSDERKAARRWLEELDGLRSRKLRAEKGAIEFFWDAGS